MNREDIRELIIKHTVPILPWSDDEYEFIDAVIALHNSEVNELQQSLVKERLINYIDTRINYFSGGDEMKSVNESIRDEIFVEELKKMKKIINNNNF